MNKSNIESVQLPDGVAFTTQGAANYLGYGAFSLYRARVTGELGGAKAPKFIRRGRLYYYYIASLDEWQAQFNEPLSNKAQADVFMAELAEGVAHG